MSDQPVEKPAPEGDADQDEARTEPTQETAPEQGGEPEAADEAPADPLLHALSELTGQNALLRSQVAQLYSAVDQLWKAVSHQCNQLLQSDAALQAELQRFQTGDPQHALFGVYAKLFRDLTQYIHQLDQLVETDEGQELEEPDRAWVESIRVARDGFEAILADWGCLPIPIAVGQDEFDPTRHEAVEAQPGEVPDPAPENVIVKVRRRGWQLHGEIIKYPVVVVG